MKPPNIATPPPDQQQQATLSVPPMQQLQQPSSLSPPATTVTSTITSTITATPAPQQSTTTIPTKLNQQQPPPITQTSQPSSTTDTTSIATGQQQAPLALTTQPQAAQVGPQLQAAPPMTIAPQSTQPIVLAISPLSATGPNHSVIVTTAQITLATQSTPIQLQAPITTHMSNITPGTNLTTNPNVVSATTTPTIAPVPLNAHQQSTASIVQSTLTNHPPTTLPIVPISTTSVAPIKSEPIKYVCCLLDNGIRCDRIAGNASFSARIQKIVGTKKMNFALDPTVRHAYICEHHKAIITVAKKSTTLARDTKASARNYTANSNSNTLASQASTNYNDLSMRQQQVLQHPMNLEMMNNQNRLANNHAGPMNSITMRQGPQVAYGHYPGVHVNQVGSMDIMMGGMDCAGGDSVASSSGGVDVDLQQLQVNTLRRYKRHFRVQTRPGLNKMQLAESLKGHFRTLPIIEKEAITYFVYIVKCYRNKLDHNPKAD